MRLVVPFVIMWGMLFGVAVLVYFDVILVMVDFIGVELIDEAVLVVEAALSFGAGLVIVALLTVVAVLVVVGTLVVGAVLV